MHDARAIPERILGSRSDTATGPDSDATQAEPDAAPDVPDTDEDTKCLAFPLHTGFALGSSLTYVVRFSANGSVE